MTYISSDVRPELTQEFQGLDVDQQLALFWYIYKKMGSSITPAAPGASKAATGVANSLFDQVAALSHEEQLQLQRDLIRGKNTLVTREYGALSNTTKLLFWYLLAQGMEQSKIVPFPANYELVESAQSLLKEIEALGFEQQITVFRNIVAPMGVDPNEVPHDPETGL